MLFNFFRPANARKACAACGLRKNNCFGPQRFAARHAHYALRQVAQILAARQTANFNTMHGFPVVGAKRRVTVPRVLRANAAVMRGVLAQSL